MKILMASFEILPYAKVGGLADMVASLSSALCDKGMDVRGIMPLFGAVDRQDFGIEHSFEIKGGRAYTTSDLKVKIWESRIKGGRVHVYFIEAPGLFDRKGIYNDPDTGMGYEDNGERFITFCKAVVEAIPLLDFSPDILHCHDHQSALIPLYLKTSHREEGKLKTVFTIHNLGYQGIFPPHTIKTMGFSDDVFTPMGPFEFYGNVNFMKLGITHADRITTVSPRYAEEIQSGSEYGQGLEGVLASRKSVLKGILNGIDNDFWNPAADPLIPHPYSVEDMKGKEKNKKLLLKTFEIPPSRGRTPLFGMISRLTDQKGFDILLDAIERLLSLDMALVILGTGEKKYHELLSKAAKKYPDKLGLRITFDEKLAHLIEAGADAFLMPSKYEPCGLNQFYSFRYGTIPVVRETGGLADSVTDVGKDPAGGTGFTFIEYSPEALVQVVERTIKFYRTKKKWEELRRKVMLLDFSWKSSAKQYMELYREIANGSSL